MAHRYRKREHPAPRPFVIRRIIGGTPAYLGYRRGTHFWTARLREALPFVTAAGAEIYLARRDLGPCEVVVVAPGPISGRPAATFEALAP